jgi:hypothetical protein
MFEMEKKKKKASFDPLPGKAEIAWRRNAENF